MVAHKLNSVAVPNRYEMTRNGSALVAMGPDAPIEGLAAFVAPLSGQRARINVMSHARDAIALAYD